MDAQQAGTFDKKAFIASVKAAIEAKSPKTLKEADEYKESGKAGEVKGDVKGLVTQGKEGQAKDIEPRPTAAARTTSKAVPKPVTPMGPEQPGRWRRIPATGAVPKPAPPEQLNLEAGKHAGRTRRWPRATSARSSSQDSNEPQFEQALADKKEAAAHADSAPGRVPPARAAGHRAEQGRGDRRDQARAWRACRAPRGRRWRSWSPTRGRPSPRTSRSEPRSPPRSRRSSTRPRPT